MFAVNDRFVQAIEMEMLESRLHKLALLKNDNASCIAICTTDAYLVISVTQFVKKQGGSVLLIYGNTPLQSAVEQASRAGCDWLLYEDLDHLHELGRFGDGDPSAVMKPSLYQFSSGTTGLPKLISRPWEQVDEEIYHYNRTLVRHGLAESTPIILSSISHSYGLITGVLSALQRGVTPVIGSSNNPKQLIRLIQQHSHHLIYSNPGLLHAMSDWFQVWQLHLDAVVTSGAPMSSKLYERMYSQTECLIQQYGCTETGAVSLAIGMNSHRDLGFPLEHVQIHHSDQADDSSELIILKASSQQKVATGDLGTVNSDGRITFIGRMDDLINVSGLKVQPMEIEEIIASMEGVEDVVVYRGIHPIQGDLVRARIVTDVRNNEEIDAEKIRSWCSKNLPDYKVPSDIRFVEYIPKMPNGKISRQQIGQEDIDVES